MSDLWEKYDFIIVGAGVVGPALARGLASHGRKVLILERDLNEPDRFVGELMQPGGIEALRKLGMEKALEGINAAETYGYQVFYEDRQVRIPYPELCDDFDIAASTREQPKTLAQGRGFHHGKFVQNLRKIARETDGVDLVQATVIDIITNPDTGHVLGVHAKVGEKTQPMYAKQVVICDGINSKFRKQFHPRTPVVKSYFVGCVLENPDLPAPHYGHVFIGKDHKPVLIYQISPTEARILCDVPAPLPSASNGALKSYVLDKCLPVLPERTQPSLRAALEKGSLRTMPNQYLPASKIERTGLIMVGDALNMRHPLTGGGMTVGLADAALLSDMIGPSSVDITNVELMPEILAEFHKERKNTAAVINVLSIALYSLFSAPSADLVILQKGCFRYFERGGECVRGPVSLLSGLLPRPSQLFVHFFAVAFYAIYLNFLDKGIFGFPLALLQVFTTFYTATRVFVPFLMKELW